MLEPIRGIHHITAIAGDPQRNINFYTQTLGLRLVKLTVNFDDPGSYHLYFGDSDGHPGTIMTFFAWPDGRPGKHGAGQVGMVAFNIPLNSIGYWVDRLRENGVTISAPFERFDEQVLALRDPDGLWVELVATSHGADDSQPWTGGPVPAENAIRGFGPPTLLIGDPQASAELLSGIFGFQKLEQSGGLWRFSGEAGAGGRVNIQARPAEERGGIGAGVVHHIAWRAPSDTEQLAWRELLVERGFNVTPVIDRQYFHSIYFREPGGILFEIATDPPGFATDESLEVLGTSLKLPPWYEPQRASIEAALPPVSLPQTQKPLE